MEHRKALISSITMIDSSNNNNSHHHHHHNRRKKRTAKRQQLPTTAAASSSLTNDPHAPSLLNTELNSNPHKLHVPEQSKEHISMKKSLAWTKKWTKWFSPCGTQRVSRSDLSSTSVSVGKRARTKSENDMSKRGSIDQSEKKKLPNTTSSFAVGQIANETPNEHSSQTSYHHQSNEKVNNTNTVVYRQNSRRYSNTIFTSARCGGARTSLAVIPSTTINPLPPKQAINLSRSVDRLHSKTTRREIRYEEHDDYIPPLHSIQCHPSLDHYAKNLNPLTQFPSNHRRSQIESYQLSSINNRLVLPRPYSSNIPLSYSLQIMSKTSSDNKNKNNTYGKLSECHSPLAPLENSPVKAPRRIESAYSQFPVQEPVYANTQSLYDNILYPQSTASKGLNSTDEYEKKSCASQTQLTWTMATFSSFVDLENQSVIIPQPDPNTLYSIVQHQQPSSLSSSETIGPMKRISSDMRYTDDTHLSGHYQRPRSPASSNLIMIEKRDGSFQTNLSIAPSQDIESNKQLFIHDSTPSPVSTSSVATTNQPKQHHHHHHHRKHKSRSNANGNNITTRDVGLQVNIQTVRKITIIPQKSDESSLTTTTSSPSHLKTPRELRNVETNTEPIASKRDTSTSYEPSIRLVTSSSQTVDSSPTTTLNLQTKSAQTSIKTLRDQAIETNHRGIFVCDLSSLLKGGPDDSSSSTSSSLTTKRKS